MPQSINFENWSNWDILFLHHRSKFPCLHSQICNFELFDPFAFTNRKFNSNLQTETTFTMLQIANSKS